jgi:hypothetical protein
MWAHVGVGVGGGVDGVLMAVFKAVWMTVKVTVWNGVEGPKQHQSSTWVNDSRLHSTANTPMLGLKPLTAAYHAVAQRPRGSTSCCRWPERQRKDARTWQGAMLGTVLSVSPQVSQSVRCDAITMTS